MTARQTSSALVSLGVLPRLAARSAVGGVPQGVVDGDVRCGGEGVRVGVHRASRLDVGFATPIMDTLLTSAIPWNQSSRGRLLWLASESRSLQSPVRGWMLLVNPR